MLGNNIHTYERGQHGRYTAISRKVVGKSAPTIPKGIVGGFEFAVLQRNLKEWHERPWTPGGVLPNMGYIGMCGPKG